MTENWASMPLVDDEKRRGVNYGVRPKYRIDAGTVIHQGDRAYFPLITESKNHELLRYSDVRVLTDMEVGELEQELPYPLPSGSSGRDIGDQQGRVGLGDVIAKITHMLGISECSSCRKRRRWLNKITIGWQRRNNNE